VTSIATERLDAFVIARLATAGRSPRSAAIVAPLRRFAPRDLTDAQWRQAIADAIDGLRARGVVDAALRVLPGELARRIGPTAARKWQQLADRVLPALALQIEAGDAKAHARLDGRDAWAAAIVARALGVWRAGPPPASLGAMCDALVWQALGLPGAPRPCPAEVRTHFLRQRVGGEAGSPERLVREHAVHVVGAPRADLGALREALVRGWLAGREVGAAPPGAPTGAAAGAAAGAPAGALVDAPAGALVDAPADAAVQRSLIADVQAVARAARAGVFGERKVFISSIWSALRAMPAWAQLELDDLKARLVAAHRSRELGLARADLVAAMDPALVAASETRIDGATFHFVVREPRT
jgi:hypothetical protein